jgi:hypothetical protein
MPEQMPAAAHRQFLIEHLPYELDIFEQSYASLHDVRFDRGERMPSDCRPPGRAAFG